MSSLPMVSMSAPTAGAARDENGAMTGQEAAATVASSH